MKIWLSSAGALFFLVSAGAWASPARQQTAPAVPAEQAPATPAEMAQRPEIYYDPQGQRTGTPATYYEWSVGWQHWLSPQVEIRPEVGYYISDGAKAFNGGTKNFTLIGASDIIWHF